MKLLDIQIEFDDFLAVRELTLAGLGRTKQISYAEYWIRKSVPEDVLREAFVAGFKAAREMSEENKGLEF